MATYDQSEKSIRSGAPVEYARFTLGEQLFRYTTSPIEETLFGEIYQPVDFKRTAPSLSPEISQNQITFSMPRNIELPALFAKASPRQQIFVIIYRKHRGELDAEAISYWQGGVEGVAFKGEMAEIVAGSLESTLKRGGLRYRFQPNCRFYLCDGRCPVPAPSVTTEAIIETASGAILSAPEFDALPDGILKFGELTTPELESRFIVDHVGATVTLIAPFPESPQGKLCKALQGCDYTPETCETIYGDWTDEGRAFGGFDSVPVENLFEKGIR